MKRILLLPVLLLSLAIGGCSTLNDFGSRIGGLISTVTTTITNPITGNNIYQVKNAYAAALTLAVEWRTYCYARPYSVLMADPIAGPICQNRREIVRRAQIALPKARNAINAAENFVTNNPTLNAATAINAAWQAVTDFQNVVPRVN